MAIRGLRPTARKPDALSIDPRRPATRTIGRKGRLTVGTDPLPLRRGVGARGVGGLGQVCA
jgi:hypothetical protein